MSKNDFGKQQTKKTWPENCVWPKPCEWSFDYDEDTLPMELDEDAEELEEIKDYFDSLVEEGRLNEDYSLNEDYDEEEDFTPKIGIDYWDDGFDVDGWRMDLSAHINLLKISINNPVIDPVCNIQNAINYRFVNENLLRQAFTRRAFAIERGLEGYSGHEGCSEELEFLGDSIMNTIVTHEIIRQFAANDCINVEAPFTCKYHEGELTRLRARFICKEHLSTRAIELGLDEYILYGTGEEPSESSREDMMEALIGAVAVDCNWNMDVLEKLVNQLLNIQLDCPDMILKKSYYEIFNAWHQKHFGEIPKYEVYEKVCEKRTQFYYADIRFSVPENDKGIYTRQYLSCEDVTRSAARERAAKSAYLFVVMNGLWVNLKDAGIVPDQENSINQLQELFQKKYVDEKPEYEYEERPGDRWYVSCVCGSFHGWGEAGSKVKAKKQAAYMTIASIYKSAGLLS